MPLSIGSMRFLGITRRLPKSKRLVATDLQWAGQLAPGHGPWVSVPVRVSVSLVV
jgi:hypothetical protein